VFEPSALRWASLRCSRFIVLKVRLFSILRCNPVMKRTSLSFTATIAFVSFKSTPIGWIGFASLTSIFSET